MRILSFLISILICNISIGQEVIEIPFKSIDEDYIELINSIKEIEDSESQEVINFDVGNFEKFNDLDTRYLMFWELSFHYAGLKDYNKCFEILKKGQSEGFYFVLNIEQAFPSYLKELEKLDGFQLFLEQNQTLKKATNTIAKTEYMVQLPKAYNKNNNYPILLIMHGGSGSIPHMQYAYNSQKLENEFIVVYFQGSNMDGSYLRSFSRKNWSSQITTGYNQIISNYSVDTTKIILSGPSAGGYRCIQLGLNNIIPAKGLLLNFSVIPRSIPSTAYMGSAERELKVVQLCGENDWAIKQQKEFGYWLDKYTIENRFVVFPEKGHQFPSNFQHHLDTSIEFILKEDE